MAIFAEFATLKASGEEPNSVKAQAFVSKLQKHITANYYTCTDDILKGLGQMYVADECFKKNIDMFGEGTAEFVRDAITSAQLNGSEVDLSAYAKKEDLEGLASEDYVEDFVEEKLATFEIPEMPSKIILLGGDATPEDDG
jgi:hypothetical protein